MVPTQSAEFVKMRKKFVILRSSEGCAPLIFDFFQKKNFDWDILHSDVQESAIKKKVSMSL